MSIIERSGIESRESYNSRVKGVAGIIVSQDKKILVGREQTDKPESLRRKGQLSIPMETLKAFEGRTELGMIKALLSEIATDDSVLALRHGLENAGIIGTVPVHSDYDMAVLLLRWNGSSEVMPFDEACPDEFNDLKWVGVNNLLNPEEMVRPYARMAVEFALRVNRQRPSPVEFRPLYLQKYFPSKYANLRDSIPDVCLSDNVPPMGSES